MPVGETPAVARGIPSTRLQDQREPLAGQEREPLGPIEPLHVADERAGARPK